MNIIYMGTPEFAVKPLQAIVDAGHKVLACFTQPDKPKGRGKTLQPTPVKEKALSLDIPVYQPIKLREEENVQIIRDYQPDAIVVAAYGQILPESILNIPQYGCINIHASLLPKYRGAAPIEWTIINGETDTGVTLHDKLADAGAELILSTLSKLENHTAIRTPQDDSLSCYASMLKKEMGELDFTKDAASLERLIRGLQPWPVAYTKMNQKTVRIYEASVCEQPEEALEDGTQIVPGMIVRVTKKNFTVACGNGALMIRKLQPEGKKPMDCAAFLAGNKLKTGQMIYE